MQVGEKLVFLGASIFVRLGFFYVRKIIVHFPFVTFLLFGARLDFLVVIRPQLLVNLLLLIVLQIGSLQSEPSLGETLDLSLDVLACPFVLLLSELKWAEKRV